mgnify:CR=1 FL=1
MNLSSFLFSCKKQTKIKSHHKTIEIFKNEDTDTLLRGQYWNYKKKKSYKNGQTTIGLILLNRNENLWLLFHVGKITKDLNILDGNNISETK